MIRYLLKDDVYYSLDDVTTWLVQEAILTPEQSLSYRQHCKYYISAKLADAYNRQRVYQHLEPFILPLSDYFVHWVVWNKLLTQLPEKTRSHPKVDTLSLLLDNPETVYLRSRMKYGIQLVNLTAEEGLAAFR